VPLPRETLFDSTPTVSLQERHFAYLHADEHAVLTIARIVQPRVTLGHTRG
jgi:hypothetical protein